jgi:hypothetical protein
MSSAGYPALKNKPLDKPPAGYTAHPVGYNSPLQIAMAVLEHFFFKI